jgi:hypothetical protein
METPNIEPRKDGFAANAVNACCLGTIPLRSRTANAERRTQNLVI